VLLDEGEDVAVAVAADLVEHAPLVVVQARDRADAGDPVGEERLGEVEIPALEAVVDGPRVLDGALEALGVGAVVREHGGHASVTCWCVCGVSYSSSAMRAAARTAPSLSTGR